MSWNFEFWKTGRVHALRDEKGRFVEGHRKIPREIADKISETEKGRSFGHKWSSEEVKTSKAIKRGTSKAGKTTMKFHASEFAHKMWDGLSEEEREARLEKIHEGARRYWERVRSGEIEHPRHPRDSKTGKFVKKE